MKEFKVVEFPMDKVYHLMKNPDFSALEDALAQYSADGWDVVSVCPNNYLNNTHGHILITLERDGR